VHGYHPAAEDAAIYVPGIKKLLHPALYPFNDEFFAAHASRTLFPRLIATSVKLTHLPFDYALLSWHLLSIFLFLLACWRIATHCFPDITARWGAVLLVAGHPDGSSGGTALFLLDPYLNPRSLSAPAILFALANLLESQYLSAALWLVVTALIHPLMVVFGVAYFLALLLPRVRPIALAVSPLALFVPGLQPASEAYRESLDIPAHSFFFLARWQWYEWVGILAPLALLAGYRRIARKRDWRCLESLTSALIVYWSGILCRGADDNRAEENGGVGIFAAYALAASSLYSLLLIYRRNAGRICASPARLAMAGSVLAALRGDVLRAAPDFPSKSTRGMARSRPRELLVAGL